MFTVLRSQVSLGEIYGKVCAERLRAAVTEIGKLEQKTVQYLWGERHPERIANGSLTVSAEPYNTDDDEGTSGTKPCGLLVTARLNTPAGRYTYHWYSDCDAGCTEFSGTTPGSQLFPYYMAR